jgi:hypothetical protein
MPAKTRTVKWLRELPASGVAPVRRLPSKPGGLYLLELRSHAAPAGLPKRKLVLTIQLHEGDDGLPRPVKITHT